MLMFRNNTLDFNTPRFFLIGFALFNLTLLGCAAKEADRIADAQSCLDKANPSNVSECMEKVQGIETQQAYVIRCAGKFIEEGFSETKKFVDALNALQNQKSGSNSMVGMMSQLAFSSDASAAETTTYCKASGSPGLIMFSSVASLATTFKEVGELVGIINANSDTPPTAEQLTRVIDDLVKNPKETTIAAVGQTVLTVQQSYCSGDSGNADVCANFDAAVAGKDSPAEVGTALIALLNSQKK